MAERELNIVKEARITLNDVSEPPRWSTERLMKLLEDGQRDLCKAAPLLTHRANINTAQGSETYRLPLDCVRLLRASCEGLPLPLVSYDAIEDVSADWEEDTGSVSHLVVNSLDQQEIRPYPMAKASQMIKVRYHSLPVELGWDEETTDSVEELEVSSMWDGGLTQFIVGKAFLDYGDEASNSRAGTALKMFGDAIYQAKKLSRKSFSKRVVSTTYQAKVSSLIGGREYGSSNCRSGY